VSDMIPSIKAVEARARMASGTAILVDVREPLEHARERIAGAVSMPLSCLDPQALRSAFQTKGAPAVIFHCQGGQRTTKHAAQLGHCGVPRAYLLEGGLNAWKEAGLATLIDRAKPIELQRQVQIAVGSLVLFGLALSQAVSPWLLLIPAFVGSGLVFAGLSGWCGMAKLLAAMPWNRVKP
jgi:rhodanese-related sulfurtransferase